MQGVTRIAKPALDLVEAFEKLGVSVVNMEINTNPPKLRLAENPTDVQWSFMFNIALMLNITATTEREERTPQLAEELGCNVARTPAGNIYLHGQAHTSEGEPLGWMASVGTGSCETVAVGTRTILVPDPAHMIEEEVVIYETRCLDPITQKLKEKS